MGGITNPPPPSADGSTIVSAGGVWSVGSIGNPQIAAGARDFIWVMRGGAANAADGSMGNVSDGDTLYCHLMDAVGSHALTATESAAVRKAGVALTIDGFAVLSDDNTLAGIATWTLRRAGADTGMTASVGASSTATAVSTGSPVAYTASQSIGLKVAGPAPVVAGIYHPYTIVAWGRLS